MTQPQIGSFELIPLAEILPSATNPRKQFNKDSLEELTNSIRESGVQQPIIIRPRGTPAIGKEKVSAPYELVCGARRMKAAAAAGMETIPAIIRDLDDAEAYRVQILENLQREDLGPMEEAEGYAVLAKQGLSSQEIATRLGKPPAYVHQRIKLLELGPKAQKALREGTLQLGFALELAKLKGKEQDEAFGWCTAQWDRPRSVEALRQRINEHFRLELKSAPFSTKATNLHPTAGSCVECPKRTGADSLLFGDIQGDDRCLDSKCYKEKVRTVIHVRVEELKKTQDGNAPLLSESYTANSAPKGTLGTSKYSTADKPYATCDKSILGVLIEGGRIGQKLRICVDASCKVHGNGRNERLDAAAQKKRLEADRKAKLEQKIRIRVAEKLAELVLADAARMIDDRDVLDLAAYAFHRMDGSQTSRLAKILGWDQKLFRYDGGNGSKARVTKLEELGAGKAAVLAVLASVAGDLSVQHQYSAAPNKLVALAKRNGVDVDAIRNQITEEARAKTDKKTIAKKKAAKKVPVKKVFKLNAAGKKRIADAMKKRWAQRRKEVAR